MVANVDGELYPAGEGAQEKMLDILARQVASPVQFVKGLRTLYEHGARVFVEVGPKRALQGFAADVLGDDGVVSLATNHPKAGRHRLVQLRAVRPLGRRDRGRDRGCRHGGRDAARGRDGNPACRDADGTRRPGAAVASRDGRRRHR